MKNQQEQPNSLKSILKIIIPIIGFLLMIYFTGKMKNDEPESDPEGRITDSLARKPVKEDSIQLGNRKISMTTFTIQYAAESWYSEFSANKVAFDKKYNESLIDIHGTINKISNNHDCAQITISCADDGLLKNIIFYNCPDGKDHWSDEVAATAVGQEVHIRGVYSGQLSSDYEMNVYKCHIINN